MPKQWKEINKKKKVTEITKHSYSLKKILEKEFERIERIHEIRKDIQ